MPVTFNISSTIEPRAKAPNKRLKSHAQILDMVWGAPVETEPTGCKRSCCKGKKRIKLVYLSNKHQSFSVLSSRERPSMKLSIAAILSTLWLSVYALPAPEGNALAMRSPKPPIKVSEFSGREIFDTA
ncbi:hypothetical protein CVT24_011837 [Panaeolus cyanescens]|uniref:Uncharacterized protein n=1 Tax=Panaeolus cyanescens TaxID=181874 RepID=A0A409YNV4_9AGAR|nr:hypothetical protein CVT24_011837 [Panaeolus cyanescens]